MAILEGPQKGSVQDLAISQEADKRFFVGLAWDPVDRLGRVNVKARSGLMGVLLWPFTVLKSSANLVSDVKFARGELAKDDAQGRDKDRKVFDLDLCCYIFDADFNFKVQVSPEDNDSFSDASKKVYHSGEDQTGFGGGDDETVSVNTKGLPEDYVHFFFVVKSDSKNGLQDVKNPQIRLADGKTGHNASHILIAPPSYNASAMVYCHVFRAGESWKFNVLDEYTDFDQNWAEYLPTLGRRAAA